jgi:two-component system nitrate/nitrite response regulator NarL
LNRRTPADTGRNPHILLADAHRCIVEGLASLLLPSVGKVSIVHDGDALVRRVMQGGIDVVVSDIAMDGLSGLQALRKLRAKGSKVPFIVLSMHDEPLIVREAMQYGAAGYVLKQSASAELCAAIEDVLQGNHYLSPSLMASLIQAPAATHKLTRRQREVIERMAEGRRAAEIAEELGISVRTVESHRQSLLDMFGVHSSIALVREAERLGLIRTETGHSRLP